MSKQSKRKAQKRAEKPAEKQKKKVSKMALLAKELIPWKNEGRILRDILLDEIQSNGFYRPGIERAFPDIKDWLAKEEAIFVSWDEKGLYKSTDPQEGKRAAERKGDIGEALIKRRENLADVLMAHGIALPSIRLIEQPRLPPGKG